MIYCKCSSIANVKSANVIQRVIWKLKKAKGMTLIKIIFGGHFHRFKFYTLNTSGIYLDTEKIQLETQISFLYYKSKAFKKKPILIAFCTAVTFLA